MGHRAAIALGGESLEVKELGVCREGVLRLREVNTVLQITQSIVEAGFELHRGRECWTEWQSW